MQKVVIGKEAEKLLSRYVSFPKSQVVEESEEITLKAPLVLKLISPQAVHKTEIGGVAIVKFQGEVENAFNDLVAKAKKHKLKDWKIQVQEFIKGTEVIIGLKNDPTFNHVVVLGLGGIYTEALKDISIRKCPITSDDAEDMINELRATNIIRGMRGISNNVNSLKKALVHISTMPQKYKDLQELDINPFILNEKHGIAVDARIVI